MKKGEITQMTFRLETSFCEQCKEQAQERGQTLAEWIRRAMKEKLEREKAAAKSDPTLEERLKAFIAEEVARATARAGIEAREDVVMIPSASGEVPLLVRKQKDGRFVLLESEDERE